MSKTFDAYLAQYREQFANYTLTELGAEPASYFKLRKPGLGSMEGVDIVITGGPGVAERVIVTGDLCPNDNAGCISNLGYGLGWFSGRLGSEYMCSKFLRTTWVPETAREWLVGRLDDARAEAADEAFDEDDRAKATERITAIEEALRAEDGCDDPTRSAEAFGDWYVEAFGDCPEGEGYGYVHRDAALLVAIQETFARLYWAARDAKKEGGGVMNEIAALVTLARHAKEKATTWRTRAGEATPGPWTTRHAGGARDHEIITVKGFYTIGAVHSFERPAEDASFIANARTVLPEAADEVDALAAGVLRLIEDNVHLQQLLEHKVEPIFGPFRKTADGQIEVPVRDAAGVGEFIFQMFGGLLEGTFRGGEYAKNYIVLSGTSQLVGRIDVTIQRVGKVSPHEARKEAERHLARAVALLAEHGIAWDGPTAVPPDDPPQVDAQVPAERTHPEWCEIRVDMQPNVLRCKRCLGEQEMPAEGTATILKAMLTAFGDRHSGCRDGDAAKLRREAP